MLQKRSFTQLCPAIMINGKLVHRVEKSDQTPVLENITATANQINVQPKREGNQLVNQKKNPTARMKLKDYLFLAETSASKSAVQKRKILQCKSHRRNKVNSQNDQITFRDMDTSMKKNKYGIKNSEMFQILKNEIYSQLQESIEEIGSFKDSLRQKNGDRVIPSSQQMMTMYKIRALLKQKMRVCLKDMKSIVQKYNPKQEGVQFQIQLDEFQLRKDISFTQQKFGKKYLQLQENQKKG